MESSYIETEKGYIHKNDIPVVQDETLFLKFNKSLIIFVNVVFILLLIYFISCKSQVNKLKKENFISSKVNSSVKANSIDIYSKDIFDLKSIMLLDNSSPKNIIDINKNIVNINKNVKKYRSGTHYMINFDEMDISEILIETDLLLYPLKDLYVNIDLYNDGKKVWQYNDFLQNTQQNSILISKVFMAQNKNYKNHENYNLKKIIFNENEFALKLSENDEDYINYKLFTN
jgi:hypothetical protein